MIRRLLLFIVLSGLILGIGCDSSNKEKKAIAVPVEVMVVKPGNVKKTLMFNGDVRAEYEVKVFSKIPDRINRFYVDEGDRVSKGNTIAVIEAVTMKQAVRRARAALAAARSQEANMAVEYERAKRLHSEKAMSSQQYDAVQTQYEAAQAQREQAEAGLASAESGLKNATITAPIAGIIGKRYYETGDMAAPSLPVVSIVQVENVKMVFEATEKDLGRLRVGQESLIKVRSYPDEVFSGILNKISPILDPVTRMATVEVLVPNSKNRLKPGMFAHAEITTGILQQTLIVPRYAVIETTAMKREHGGTKVVRSYYVYVVNDSSKAEQRYLEIDYADHKNIAVDTGIRAGERIVISGQNKLRDGIFVHIAAGEEAEL